MEFLGMDGFDVRFRVTVSTGSYVRTLCHDVGETLGVHAHMKDLARTVSGSYTLEQSVALSDLEKGGIEKANEVALSLSEGLAVFSKVVVIAHAADRLKNGIPIGVSDIISYEEGARPEYIRVVDKADKLLAVGETDGAPVAGFPFMTIKPKKVFV
jgi:tRNA pseudouridine55 synthase